MSHNVPISSDFYPCVLYGYTTLNKAFSLNPPSEAVPIRKGKRESESSTGNSSQKQDSFARLAVNTELLVDTISSADDILKKDGARKMQSISALRAMQSSMQSEQKDSWKDTLCLECDLRKIYCRKTGQCKNCYNKHHDLRRLTCAEYAARYE